MELVRIENTEGLPAGLVEAPVLWESVLGPVPGRGVADDWQVRRLYPDGTLWSYSNKRRTADGRGLPRPVPGPLRWRLAAKVGDVRGVEEAIREHFMKIPEHIGEAPKVEARILGWRAHLGDGKRHVVVSRDAVEPAEVKAVEQALAKAIKPGAVPIEQPE